MGIWRKKIGRYTYEHWFDDDYKDAETQNAARYDTGNADSLKTEKANDSDDSTTLHKPRRQP